MNNIPYGYLENESEHKRIYDPVGVLEWPSPVVYRMQIASTNSYKEWVKHKSGMKPELRDTILSLDTDVFILIDPHIQGRASIFSKYRSFAKANCIG